MYGRNAVYDMPWSGRSFTILSGRDAVLRHALDGTQLYDNHGSGRYFTTYLGRDASLQDTFIFEFL